MIFPFLGVFIYLISQHRGVVERQNQRAQEARDQLRQVVGFSAADELEKLERLKNSNTISNEEYQRLRARVVQQSFQRSSKFAAAEAPGLRRFGTQSVHRGCLIENFS